MNTKPEAQISKTGSGNPKLETRNPKLPTRWRCTCAYDGTDFLGWQSQRGGRTVQDFLEKRLAQIFQKPIRVHGSGRTDSGVHARAQVFHFEADWAHPVAHLQRALRSGLPAGLVVSSVRHAAPKFHARYSAKGKRYRYRLYAGYAGPFESRWCWSFGDRPLDIAQMRVAAKKLLGSHDFSAFSGQYEETENPVKHLRKLNIIKNGRRVEFVVEASGFLYKMARGLVGALVSVGLGKLTPADIERLLHSQKRTQEIVTAPAVGLSLEKVFYD
jgi:tRNA pseudouridine38-40 synthase